jgi:hypothetical protein
MSWTGYVITDVDKPDVGRGGVEMAGFIGGRGFIG